MRWIKLLDVGLRQYLYLFTKKPGQASPCCSLLEAPVFPYAHTQRTAIIDRFNTIVNRGSIMQKILSILVSSVLTSLTVSTLSIAASPTGTPAAVTPLRIVVPYAAGGAGDMIARTLGERITSKVSRPVVVENKPGGGTVIGSQAVASAPADGMQVLLVAASFIINPHLMAKMPFAPLTDFAPLTLIASNPHVLVVSNAVPATNLKELMAWARARNGSATFASFGNGSSGHLGFEMLKKAGNFEMIHVPYKGSAPAMTDLFGGHVDAMLTDLPQVIEAIKAGKLKAIAIAATSRAPTLPQVATVHESGLADFESKSWYGLVVKNGAPPATVASLTEAFTSSLREPEVRLKFEQSGLDVIGSTTGEFAQYLKRESVKYGQAVKASGVRID